MYSMYKQGNIDHLMQAKEIIKAKPQPVVLKEEVDQKMPSDYVKQQAGQPVRQQAATAAA